MADWRKCAATNQPGTCLWCGQKLRQKMRRAVSTAEAHRLAIADEPIPMRPMYDAPGDYGDGYFCGLRCAYQFAVVAAGHHRISPKQVAS